MAVADEDLRHCRAAAGLLHHLVTLAPLARDLELGEADALLVQELLGGAAIGAPRFGVDGDGRHRVNPVAWSQMEAAPRRHNASVGGRVQPSVTTRAKDSTSTARAPPRRRAREAAFAV